MKSLQELALSAVEENPELYQELQVIAAPSIRKSPSRRKIKKTFVKERNILLRKLGNFAIKNNLYRKQNVFFLIKPSLLKKMTAGMSLRIKNGIDGGYMFLDEKGGKTGLIRLHLNEKAGVNLLNPKWDFKMNKKKILLY
jgi:hypothetical protein